MKQINTEILKSLNPCADRYAVWLKHYKKFDGSLVDFLELDKITAQDKIWVAIHVMPRFLIEVFAIDCAFSAYAADAAAATNTAYVSNAYAAAATTYAAVAAAYATTYAAAAAADAAYATTYAAAAANSASSAAFNADAYYATANADAERETQVDALIMLLESER